MTQQSISGYVPSRNELYLPKDMIKNVHSSFIHSSPKLETIYNAH